MPKLTEMTFGLTQLNRFKKNIQSMSPEIFLKHQIEANNFQEKFMLTIVFVDLEEIPEIPKIEATLDQLNNFQALIVENLATLFQHGALKVVSIFCPISPHFL